MQISRATSYVSNSKSKIESFDWETAKASETVREYLWFKEQYPGSERIIEADRNIAELRRNESFWLSARNEASIERIDQFLADFPGHKNEKEAIKFKTGQDFRVLSANGQIESTFGGCGIKAVCGQFKNLTDAPIRILFPAGTIFWPDDPDAQQMSLVSSQTVIIKPGATKSHSLAAACANINKDIPIYSINFTPAAPSQDERVIRFSQLLNNSGASWNVRQALSWIFYNGASDYAIQDTLRDGLTGGSIISKEEIAKATELLREAGLI